MSGQTQIKLENEVLRVVLVPRMGGKIVSFFHKAKSFEAAAQPGENGKGVVTGKDDSDSCVFAPYAYGLDEAFPNIMEENYTWKRRTRHYPDHGEIWRGRFQILDYGQKYAELAWESRDFGYLYEKRIRLEGDSLRLRYRIKNMVEEELPAIWTWHGLMRYEEDMEILMPDGAAWFRNVLDSPDLGEEGAVYPLQNACYDFTKVPRAESCCAVKYYVESRVAEGYCGFYYPSSHMSCMLQYDAGKLPYLGIWITAGGFQGDYNCALEPSNGFYDSISKAAGNHRLPVLAAGESLEFELWVSLAEGHGAPKRITGLG